MAERRMLAKTITESDAFLDMPQSSQNLYFHLNMNADDDGFVNNPKKIQRTVGSSNDDLNILLAKSFLIPFESGVVVIKHWKIHNYIRSDRYKPTAYIEEKNRLTVKENGSYTMAPIGIPDVNQTSYQMETQVRLGKDRVDEDREREEQPLTFESTCKQISKEWNTRKLGPQFRFTTSLGLNAKEREGFSICVGRYSLAEILKAFDNFGAIIANTDEYDAFPKDYRLPGFLASGVEQYLDDARPFDRCRKKQAGPHVTRTAMLDIPEAQL